jgi:hypothetical protein
VIVIVTAGISILGVRSIPRVVKEYQPTRVKTKKPTMVGTGFLIDQAERLKDIGWVRKRQLLTIVTG